MSDDRLSANAQGRLHIDGPARLHTYWENVFVETEQVEKVHKELEDRFSRADSDRPMGLLVWGESWTGKSYMLEEFVKDKMKEAAQNPVRENLYANIPVFRISLPVNNETEFYELIITKLGREFNPFAQTKSIPIFARELLIQCGVKLLIFDELHNIIPESKSDQSQLLKIIKELSNKTRRPIVFGGTRVARRFLFESKEVENRFSDIVVPGYPTCDDDFLDLLHSFEHVLPLRKPSRLDKTKGLADYIHQLTGGRIGGVHELLRHAALHAIRTGDEQITRKSIDETPYGESLRRRMVTKAK